MRTRILKEVEDLSSLFQSFLAGFLGQNLKLICKYLSLLQNNHTPSPHLILIVKLSENQLLKNYLQLKDLLGSNILCLNVFDFGMFRRWR
jgi:hypothetical protein